MSAVTAPADHGPAFAGRVALVTGGGTGIGAATARRLAAEGAFVGVLGRRPEPIHAVADEIGGLALVADASDSGRVGAAVSELVATRGRVDVLVANAGGGGIGALTDTDDAMWAQALGSNLTSAFTVARAAVPHLIATKGTIVVVASMAGLYAPGAATGYVAAKHAAVGLTKSLARDLGPAGVRVNAVCPMWTRTELSERVLGDVARARGLSVDEVFERVAVDVPLGRIAEADEIAAVVRFLASDEASILTGCVVTADGGASVVDVGSLAFGHLVLE